MEKKCTAAHQRENTVSHQREGPTPERQRRREAIDHSLEATRSSHLRREVPEFPLSEHKKARLLNTINPKGESEYETALADIAIYEDAYNACARKRGVEAADGFIDRLTESLKSEREVVATRPPQTVFDFAQSTLGLIMSAGIGGLTSAVVTIKFSGWLVGLS